MEEHLKGYRFLKHSLGIVFYLYYRPKIFNKEVIPNDGPIIICGNHVHLFDQNIACLATKRMLHYMAKVEYFRDKKKAWFFNMAGCIPVDREAHDGIAKDKAMGLLNKGDAIGIFPEGTRNQISARKERMKELYKIFENDMEYDKFYKIMDDNFTKTSQIDKLNELKDKSRITENEYKTYLLNADKSLKELMVKGVISEDEYYESMLLPLKFGTVSMAQKTGATIVPFGITGKYKFRKNHLNLKFGMPFKVPEDMDLKDANKKLREEMVSILKEQNIKIDKHLI